MASGPRIIGGNSDCRIGGRDFSLRGILSAASMSERSSDTGTNCDVEMRSADRPPPGGLGGMLVHWQWNCLWRGSSTSQRVTRLARSIIAPRSFVATVKRAWPPLMLTPRSLPVNRVAMSPPSGSATSVPSPRRCARAVRRCDDRLRCVGTDRDPSEAHGKRENVGRDDSPLLSAIVARGVTSAQGPDPRERALCIASERPLSSSDIKKMTVFSQAGAADYPWSVGHRS